MWRMGDVYLEMIGCMWRKIPVFWGRKWGKNPPKSQNEECTYMKF